MDAERLSLALTSPDEEVRKEAVLTISESSDPALLGMLRQAATDPSPAVRFFARRGADKISRLTKPLAGDPWLKALEEAAGDSISVPTWQGLLSDRDPEARLRNVIGALQVTDPALLPLLLERIAVEPDVRVRASLVKAIARFRRSDSFELLARLLADPDPRVCANTVEALDDLADPRLHPLLEPLLTDPDNRIRGNALKALSRFDRPRALSGAHAMASSEQVWMRATAVWLYRELGGEQARQALERMHSREIGELASKIDGALELFEKQRHQQGPVPGLESDSAVTDVIRTKLVDPDKNVRIQAVLQAAELPPLKALPLLKTALLSEEHPHVIASLVKMLGQVSGPSEMGVISEFLRHPDARVRANAIEGMAALGTDDAFPLLEPLLGDPNRRVRANAAWVLHGRDPVRAFAALKEMLLSKDSALQDSAIFALREIADEQVLEIFETALASDLPEVQMKILRVLESWSQRNPLAAKLCETYKERGRAVPWVTEKLDELVHQYTKGEGPDRLRALDKLATFKDGGARQLLESASRDEDPTIRKHARGLLKKSDFEETRREAYFRLGLAAYQWIRDTKGTVPRELSKLMSGAKQASKGMEGGHDVLSSLSLRRQSLVSLGREVQLLMEAGRLTAPVLDPLLQDIERIEIRHEVAGLPEPAGVRVKTPRPSLMLAAGVLAGILLGCATYWLFQMPPSPNMKKIVLRSPIKTKAAAAAAVATTAAAATVATTASTGTAQPISSAVTMTTTGY